MQLVAVVQHQWKRRPHTKPHTGARPNWPCIHAAWRGPPLMPAATSTCHVAGAGAPLHQPVTTTITIRCCCGCVHAAAQAPGAAPAGPAAAAVSPKHPPSAQSSANARAAQARSTTPSSAALETHRPGCLPESIGALCCWLWLAPAAYEHMACLPACIVPACLHHAYIVPQVHCRDQPAHQEGVQPVPHLV